TRAIPKLSRIRTIGAAINGRSRENASNMHQSINARSSHDRAEVRIIGKTSPAFRTTERPFMNLLTSSAILRRIFPEELRPRRLPMPARAKIAAIVTAKMKQAVRPVLATDGGKG